MFQAVLIDYEFEPAEIERRIIAEAGGELLKPDCDSEEALRRAVAEADVVISQYRPLPARVIEAMRRAKGIIRCGIGYDIVDVEAATRRRLWVVNVPDYCLEEVATHALALILALTRKVRQADAAVRQGRWENTHLHPIYPLRGSTLGLLGFGKIPRALATLARGFPWKMLASDPWVEEAIAHNLGVELTDRQSLFERADFLSIHLPLSPHTRHSVGKAELNAMKRTAYLVNTSRGEILDEPALVEALQSGQIAGAGLDVFATEPLPEDHLLRQMPNVILTPHIAWYSESSMQTLRTRVAQEAVRLARGEKPQCPVNQI